MTVLIVRVKKRKKESRNCKTKEMHIHVDKHADNDILFRFAEQKVSLSCIVVFSIRTEGEFILYCCLLYSVDIRGNGCTPCLKLNNSNFWVKVPLLALVSE